MTICAIWNLFATLAKRDSTETDLYSFEGKLSGKFGGKPPYFFSYLFSNELFEDAMHLLYLLHLFVHFLQQLCREFGNL